MSNRDVAPRLRALDERVMKLEGGGMKDLEQKAQDVWDRIIKQRQMIQGGCEVPYEEPLPRGLILQALRDVREADAKVAYSCCHLAGFDMLALDTAAAIRSQGAK